MKYLTIFVSLFISNLFFIPTIFGSVSNIDHIIFVSESQTVAPDTISKVFTIQTQNVSGSVEPIDETADLTLSINSATGQFNSNSTTWNPATTFTMSKNTGNKNFYFKDSTLGTYTINATLTTRTTGKSWSTSQEVTVGIVIIDPEPDNGTGTTTATSTIATSTTATSSTVISTHYITQTVSAYIEPTVFEITAGRERLGYVGTPLNFEAKKKLSTDLKNKKCDYVWNFGDGSISKQADAEHIYMYVGNYNLILNGECEGSKAVSRSKVKILEPVLALSKIADGSIEIHNSSDYEINLYKWKLMGDNQEYYFPLDTIIGTNQKIIFASDYTKIINPINISLIDAKGRAVARFDNQIDLLGLVNINSEELSDFLEKYRKLTYDQI